MDAAESHVRSGWLRSLANIYHAFAVQCFTDERHILTGAIRSIICSI